VNVFDVLTNVSYSCIMYGLTIITAVSIGWGN